MTRSTRTAIVPLTTHELRLLRRALSWMIEDNHNKPSAAEYEALDNKLREVQKAMQTQA